MKAMLANDICYSTMTGHMSSVFNTDGKKRTVIDINEAAHAFDFDIVKKPSFDERGNQIPGQYHLRKSTDDTFIPGPGVGEKFTPVQHRDVYNFITTELMPKVPQMKLETVGTLYGSGMGLITATMGDNFYIPGDESPNSMRLFFSNPSNGSGGSLVLGFTTVRLFCQNQISAARHDAMGRDGFVIQHTKNANFKLDNALKSVYCQIRLAEDIKARSERLATIPANQELVTRVLDRIYPLGRFDPNTRGETHQQNLRDEVLMQFESGETAMSMKNKTAWSVFNAATFPLFNPTHYNSRTDEASIMYTGMVGSRAERVMKWFKIVEQEAVRAA